jgi:ABC-type glycerol-3-phosphate transport system substrate-binding protein
MRSKKYILGIITLIFILACAVSFGAQKLTFWNMPFVTQEVSTNYVKIFETDAKTALPNYTINNFYGPGDYKILRQKYLLQAKTGSPDVIEGLLEDEAVYVNNDIIEPLDSYFNAWSEKGMFVNSTVEPLKINGKLYAVPYNSNARALIYRKDLLKKYGLAVPKNWDQMVATARVITKKSNKAVFGLFVCTLVGDPRAPQEFISWYFQTSKKKNPFEVTTSGGTRTVKVTATRAQLEKVLGLYAKLYTGDFPACDPNQRGTGWPVEDPGYVAGKWAMAPMGPWLWGRRTESDTAKANLENNSAITRLPYPKDGVAGTYLEVKPIMMNKYAADKNAAWELLKYITSKEKMAQWLVDSGGIPCRTDSLKMDVFDKAGVRWWINGFANELPVSVAVVSVNWAPVNEANLQAVNYVIYGKKSVKDAAKWLLDTYNDLNSKGTL